MREAQPLHYTGQITCMYSSVRGQACQLTKSRFLLEANLWLEFIPCLAWYFILAAVDICPRLFHNLTRVIFITPKLHVGHTQFTPMVYRLSLRNSMDTRFPNGVGL